MTNPSDHSQTSVSASSAVKKPKKSRFPALVVKYIFFVVGFTILIGVFSVIMFSVASYRGNISDQNYYRTADVYGGPVMQNAPNLKAYEFSPDYYGQPAGQRRATNNTFIKETDARVVINTDFVKKGLVYQPTYRTGFAADYILENTSEITNTVDFEFPFPGSLESNEISNVKLVVNGAEVIDAKSKISLTGDYGYREEVDGLVWEGEVESGEQVAIFVSYDTVGLSSFDYQGFENPTGSQNFKFSVTINGTRSYDVYGGLSVDERIFGDNSVQLVWDKPNLYSTPGINVSVGGKLNPSMQVARVYLTMSPIFFVFSTILLYLTYNFGKKKLAIFDIFLVTVLFVLYFPLVHYLSSFTIDPTVESVKILSSLGYFSMPLYAAFLIAGAVIGSLMLYLLARISGKRFSIKFGIPMLLLFLGFFPLVVTIPEYSMLLVLMGVTALMAIIVQVRVNMLKKDEMVEPEIS